MGGMVFLNVALRIITELAKGLEVDQIKLLDF